MMKYTHLGRTGLEISRICLGTMNFGATTDEVEAFRMMDRALEIGINFFDTANTYNGGETDEIFPPVGQAFGDIPSKLVQ